MNHTQRTSNWMLYAGIFMLLAAGIYGLQNLPEFVAYIQYQQNPQSIQPAKAVPVIKLIEANGEVEVEHEGKPYKVEWTRTGLGECSWKVFDQGNPLKPKQWDEIEMASATMDCESGKWVNLLFYGHNQSLVQTIKNALGLK